VHGPPPRRSGDNITKPLNYTPARGISASTEVDSYRNDGIGTAGALIKCGDHGYRRCLRRGAARGAEPLQFSHRRPHRRWRAPSAPVDRRPPPDIHHHRPDRDDRTIQRPDDASAEEALHRRPRPGTASALRGLRRRPVDQVRANTAVGLAFLICSAAMESAGSNCARPAAATGCTRHLPRRPLPLLLRRLSQSGMIPRSGA
jgi:hypothetical protein